MRFVPFKRLRFLLRADRFLHFGHVMMPASFEEIQLEGGLSGNKRELRRLGKENLDSSPVSWLTALISKSLSTTTMIEGGDLSSGGTAY